MTIRHFLACGAAFAAFAATPAEAAPISVQDSFRIGSGANVLCTAQSSAADPVLGDMFDRGYRIVCRDASLPVGRLYALRLRGPDPLGRLAAARSGKVECGAPARTMLETVGSVDLIACRMKDAAVG